MKGLTLKQPWDYAHVYLNKRVENRTWRIPKDRYALHSGKGVDREGAEFIETMTGHKIDWSKIVPSAIFAVVDIIRLIELGAGSKTTPVQKQLLLMDFDEGPHDEWAKKWENSLEEVPADLAVIAPDQRPWSFGPWVHVYEPKTFRILPRPVPCGGAQGLWELPAEVWANVFEQMREMPAVVLNRHVHGKPQGSVYVGRPTKWGNPFTWRSESAAQFVVPKEEVLPRFEEWVLDKRRAPLRIDAQRELRGRDLVCSCAPHPCHANTWLRIANAA